MLLQFWRYFRHPSLDPSRFGMAPSKRSVCPYATLSYSARILVDGTQSRNFENTNRSGYRYTLPAR